MTTIYVWRGNSGAGHSEQAQRVGEELARIEAENGGLHPPQVVAAARSENSALHPYFEWRNDVAADKFRLHQARHLISHIEVKVIDDKALQTPIRAFVHLPDSESEDGHYQSIHTVMSDATKREVLINRAKIELEQWRARYAELEEFASVFRAVDKTIRKPKGKAA